MKTFILFLLISVSAIGQEFSINETKTFTDQADYVRGIRFSPYGNYVALSLGNNTTQLFDKNWNIVYTTQGEPKSKGSQCIFSPDERLLIFSKYKNQSDIAIYSIVENRVIQTLQDEGQFLSSIALSPDGKFLAFSSYETFQIYRWAGIKFVFDKEIKLTDTKVYSIAFSKDSKELIAGLYNKKPLLYTIKGDKWIKTQELEVTNPYAEKVNFSPDSKRLAISHTYSSSIDIYTKSSEGYKISQTIANLDYTAEVMCFSPDGQILGVGFPNGWIHIFQVSKADTLKVIKKIYRHDGRIVDLDFSPDGKFMSTSGADKTGVIWSVDGVKPTDKYVISNILGSDITLAQRKMLTNENAESIASAIEHSLLAPKDEFETNMEFLKRRERLKNQLTTLMQAKIEQYYSMSAKGNTLEIPLDKAVSYDADGQQYFILFLETPGKIKLSAAEAKSLKENWEKTRITIQKKKDKTGENIYSDFTLIHPVSGKIYPIEINENPFVPGSATGEKSRSSIQAEGAKSVMTDTTGGRKGNYDGVNYALIFGTNDYENYPDLVNPLYDAKTIADELFRNYGFQTDIDENGTLDIILKKLKRYAQLSYDKNDKLLIFFAGHGKYDDIFREGYLVAKESKLQDEARTTFLPHSNLRTIVNNINCEHVFLVMDVCFGGTFDPYLTAHRGTEEVYEDVAKTEFIERKMKHKTRLYLTSGGKEYVPDGRPGEHSPFARKFLEALRSYGGKDGILTVSELINYVEKVVPQPRTGEFGNNEPGSDFVFIAK